MAATAKYQVKVNTQEFEIETVKGQALTGTVNGKDYALNLSGNAKEGFSLIYQNKSLAVQVLAADYQSKTFTLQIDNEPYQIEAADKYDLLLKELGLEHLATAAVNDLNAPMPGLVLEIKIVPGDSIKKGDPVVVLEAMKMENVLKAEGEGVVKSINCAKGEAVEKNQVLVEFEV